jgi:8-oxo-dGTP diphosphatase
VIRVVVGLLTDLHGNVLIGQRRAGTHMAGRWEFPGGKRQPGESAIAALRRELREELAVEVVTAEPFIVLEHDYADRCVQLDTWLVSRYEGEPRSCEGQTLQWVPPSRLGSAAMLEADAPIIDALIARSSRRADVSSL